MGKKLSIGLVGCGSIGVRHAKHINKLARLKAVCDVKVERALLLKKEYGCNAYKSLDDLLEKEEGLDLVAICTPNGLHSEQTIKVLMKGINVLCEKPMALSVKECDKMAIAAERSNKRLFIVKQNRFNPPVIALKNLIDKGSLGKIFSMQLNCFWNRNEDYYKKSDWKGKIDNDGGILFTQFSHFIDLVCWMFGSVKKVSTYTKNYFHNGIIEFEDSAVCIVEFDNGTIGTMNFTINSFKKNMEGSLTVFGEKGTVKIGGQYLNTVEYQCVDNGNEIKNLPKANKANDYGDYQGSMSNHDKVYECVINDINNNTAFCIGSVEGRMTIDTIEKIYNSNKNGKNG